MSRNHDEDRERIWDLLIPHIVVGAPEDMATVLHRFSDDEMAELKRLLDGRTLDEALEAGPRTQSEESD